ncbi:Hypothetical protein CINCED_3A006498 [Cinara cedri]|uniref:Uncharacterized protein n=1 Tax=Cinara cedri TaxID=506608 RepID=A0A5E4N6K0_9HEMI|nr:Hypothetical protein CINCED_3A006498 [Cinara cedri]
MSVVRIFFAAQQTFHAETIRHDQLMDGRICSWHSVEDIVCHKEQDERIKKAKAKANRRAAV